MFRYFCTCQCLNLLFSGFLFFKTILYVKGTIKDIIKYPSWQRRPVRFLGVDLTLVGGVDMSLLRPSFVSIARCLRRMLCLSFVGSSLTRQLAALQSVSVLGEEFVELFTTCNDHGMWVPLTSEQTRADGFNSWISGTENGYLRAWFRSQSRMHSLQRK